MFGPKISPEHYFTCKGVSRLIKVWEVKKEDMKSQDIGEMRSTANFFEKVEILLEPNKKSWWRRKVVKPAKTNLPWCINEYRTRQQQMKMEDKKLLDFISIELWINNPKNCQEMNNCGQFPSTK